MEESSSAELMTETDYVHWFTNNELENLLKETGSTLVMIKIKKGLVPMKIVLVVTIGPESKINLDIF